MVPDRHLRYGGVGGYGNHAHGIGATVSGGIPNRATDDYATVPGGSGNIAESEYSFAAGRMAHAKYRGCFVWGDSTDDTVACNDTDEFVARASGGFYFYTSADLSTGVKLVPGASYWDNLSDRARKRDIEPVDPDHVLARLADVPIYTWRYVSQPNGGRHMGPMAQDFHAAFGLGTDDRSIGSLDADGVALAALQALDRRMARLRAELRALEAAPERGADSGNAAAGRGAGRSVGGSLWAWLCGLGLVGGVVVRRVTDRRRRRDPPDRD